MNSTLISELAAIVGRDGLLHSKRDLLAYEYDATHMRSLPDVVVLPTSTEEVSAVVKLAARNNVPVTARGAGTNLSGGTIAKNGGIVLALTRMNRILSIDVANHRAIVQPGVINLELQNALAEFGFLYAPDPASQKVSTLGGNAGEDAGGPHCLKYGVTSNHVLGLEVVLADGEIVTVGGSVEDLPAYDLTGLLVGSEGTLAVVTSMTLRIMRVTETVKTMLGIFNTLEECGNAVSTMIARGIVPAALEIMDKPVIKAVEDSSHAGYPLDAETVLIIELDGLADGVEEQARQAVEICHETGVREMRVAANTAERDALWAARRGAFGAVARIRPSFSVQDGTVPRSKLPAMLRRVLEIGKKYDILIGNVAHAGDGNLHPLFMYDERNRDEIERVEKAGKEMLASCVDLGGTLTGEHGVGLEKQDSMPLLFTPVELGVMHKIKSALDPRGQLNPGKIFPSRAES